jgi:hypothetical protein
MVINDGSTVAAMADPTSGGYLEAMTTGYGNVPASQSAVDAVAISTPAVAADGASPKVAFTLIFLIVALIALKFLSEHQKADLEVAHVRISVWNWFAVTVLALTGIVTGKALLNQWPGPSNPVTQIFNAG